MKKSLFTASLTTTLFVTSMALAQSTAWEKPVTSKLESLQPGIIAVGVAISLIAFLVGIIKTLFSRGGMESWKYPALAVFVGIAIALAPTFFTMITSVSV